MKMLTPEKSVLVMAFLSLTYFSYSQHSDISSFNHLPYDYEVRDLQKFNHHETIAESDHEAQIAYPENYQSWSMEEESLFSEQELELENWMSQPAQWIHAEEFLSWNLEEESFSVEPEFEEWISKPSLWINVEKILSWNLEEELFSAELEFEEWMSQPSKWIINNTAEMDIIRQKDNNNHLPMLYEFQGLFDLQNLLKSVQH